MKGKVKQGMKLVKICMKKHGFTFRNGYCKQLKGSPVSNPLSPFISEILIANPEMKLVSAGLMPGFWKDSTSSIDCNPASNSLCRWKKNVNYIS